MALGLNVFVRLLELIRSGDAKVVTAQLLDLGQKKKKGGDQASFQAVHEHVHPQKHKKKERGSQ